MSDTRSNPSDTRGLITVLLLAAALVSLSHSLYADVGFNLADEGFLLHGVERTRAGDVPLRDFQSYEPGRYYWIAALTPVLGDGILGLRRALALFQFLGLVAGLLVARRLVHNPVWLVPIGLFLLLWMFPRHKLFEPSLAMMAVYVSVRFLESQRLIAFALAGGFVGLSSFFGRNHALYSGLGVLLLALWIQRRNASDPAVSRVAALASGTLAGCIPLLAMLLFVPGFALALWESIVFFAEQGANLPAPIPWPWLGDTSSAPWSMRIARFLFGSVFLLVPLVCAAGFFAAFQNRRALSPARIVLIASTAIGLFYLHHASVRSDPAHLGQAIHPLMLATFAIPGAFAWRRYGVATIALCCVVALLTLTIPVRYDAGLVPPSQIRSDAFLDYQLGPDRLRLPLGLARRLSRIENTVGRRVSAEESMLIAPYSPGLYSVLGKKAPVWGLYFLWTGTDESQARMLRELERADVRWALIEKGGMDGREDLRFRRTQPRIWTYLETEFERVHDSVLPNGLVLFQKKVVPNQTE